MPDAPSSQAAGSGQRLDQGVAGAEERTQGTFYGWPSRAGASASHTCRAGCASSMFKGFLGPLIRASYSFARNSAPSTTRTIGRA